MGTGSGRGLAFGATAGSQTGSSAWLALPSVIAQEDFAIGKSLGARALNYDVRDPKTGRVHRFVEGTQITQVEVFAGKGVSKKLRPQVVSGLVSRYGGRARLWQHAKGLGTVDCDGWPRTAEVHWFQEPSVGKCEFKVKRWLS